MLRPVTANIPYLIVNENDRERFVWTIETLFGFTVEAGQARFQLAFARPGHHIRLAEADTADEAHLRLDGLIEQYRNEDPDAVMHVILKAGRDFWERIGATRTGADAWPGPWIPIERHPRD